MWYPGIICQFATGRIEVKGRYDHVWRSPTMHLGTLKKVQGSDYTSIREQRGVKTCQFPAVTWVWARCVRNWEMIARASPKAPHLDAACKGNRTGRCLHTPRLFIIKTLGKQKPATWAAWHFYELEFGKYTKVISIYTNLIGFRFGMFKKRLLYTTFKAFSLQTNGGEK